MLKTHFFAITSLLFGLSFLSGSNSKSLTEPPCDCVARPNATLYKCNSKTKATEVRCILTRKAKVKGKVAETSYVFVALKTSDKKRDLKINATIKNLSTLMYTGDIFTIDNRGSSKEFVVKINLWTQKGYTVEIRRDDFLKITFNAGTNETNIEAGGYMKECFDNNHTLTSDAVKQDIFSRSFSDPDEMVGMAVAYFIYEYNKALIPL
ncbi:MAG: hypothetical protein EAZ08_04610 [Cytophagales bacterium]|nr:MAG: hypothetical protein EAZ08_04610 [Cytophagales bacterium]